MNNQYSVSVYDSNPADGGGEWGREFALCLDNAPQHGQLSIDVRNANVSQCEELESEVRSAAIACGEYEKGDRLWLQFSDDECGAVCWSMQV